MIDSLLVFSNIPDQLENVLCRLDIKFMQNFKVIVIVDLLGQSRYTFIVE